MPDRTAFLFPGQGAYIPGILGSFRSDPHVRRTLDAVDTAAAQSGHAPVAPLLLDENAPSLEELVAESPARLHLAIFAGDIALWTLLTEGRGEDPDLVIGHSFGELAALCAAGVFGVAEATRLVLMRDAALERCGPFDGGMVALDVCARRAEAVLAAGDQWGLRVASDNAPGQVVVSGRQKDLERLCQVAEALGITATRLRVPYPFHHPMLAAAAADFTASAAGVAARPPQRRIYSPLLGRYLTNGQDALEMLGAHLVRPNCFLDAIRAVHADGMRRFVECGARGILVDLANQSVPGITTVAPLRSRSSSQGAAPSPPAASAAASVRETEAAGAAVAAGNGTAAGGRLPAVEPLGAALRVSYAQALGYPLEAFTAGIDLEADLGVDSIKQTELFAQALGRYGVSLGARKLRVTQRSTIEAVAHLLHELAAAGQGASASAGSAP